MSFRFTAPSHDFPYVVGGNRFLMPTVEDRGDSHIFVLVFTGRSHLPELLDRELVELEYLLLHLSVAYRSYEPFLFCSALNVQDILDDLPV